MGDSDLIWPLPDRRCFRCQMLVTMRLALTAALLGCVESALGQRFTPPPTLESIPPNPVSADSYEAGVVATMARYQPDEQVSGDISIWGHGNAKLPWMRHLVELWQAGFRKFHPNVTFHYHMYGTSSGVPSLFTGIGEIAILGEEILPDEVAAFERVKHYPPLGIEIATGSLDVRNFDYAQMFFVHKDNPLREITLAQLEAIFGAEPRRGLGPIRNWGQLGLTGEFAGKTITPYGWAIDDSFGDFLQTYLLAGSHKWNCALKEFVHIPQPDGSIYDHGQQILDALNGDRFGIAVSNIRYAGPDVRALRIAAKPEGPFVEASKESLVEHIYPLARTIPAVVDRPPGMPLPPKVREFLRYLLSRDGQDVVNKDGRYLPLSRKLIVEQLRKVE